MPFNRRAQRESYSPCPHYPNCFGCPLIGLAYPQQLGKKRERLIKSFADYATLANVEVPPVTPSPRRLGYRGRVKLVVRNNRGEILTGLYVPGSHRVVDISSCPVHPRPVNQVVGYLKKKIKEWGIAPYDERNDTGQLRYLDFRYSFALRDLNVTLITRQREFPQGRTLARSLQRRFSFVSGVIQNINEARGNVIWGNEYHCLAGRDSIVERIGSLKFEFSGSVFSQANPFTALKLYQKLVEFADLKANGTVLDLYSGVGPISCHLAAGAGLVRGIDDSSLAITAAKQNARRNGLSNCRFFAGDVADQVRIAKKDLPRIDLVTLNPSRKGLQSTAIEAVLDLNAPKLIYISCDPASLVRDLDRLITAGYALRRVQPFDMFPQTREVETVVLLERV